LPDSAYGEWLIFRDDVPVYYFNYFDPYYDSIREQIDRQVVGSLEKIINASFIANNLNCTTNIKKPFFSLKRREYSISLELIKYPIEYFYFLGSIQTSPE
jgi:hypothetical protein